MLVTHYRNNIQKRAAVSGCYVIRVGPASSRGHKRRNTGVHEHDLVTAAGLVQIWLVQLTMSVTHGNSS